MNDPSLSEAGDRVREDLGILREAIERETAELRDTANKLIQEHPLYVVGAAFGIGFLLSGGLFSRFTARGLSFGARFLVGRIVRQAIGGAAAGFASAR